MVEEMEQSSGQEEVALKARIAEAQNNNQRIESEAGKATNVDGGDLAAAQQLDRLEQQLRAFEAKIEEAPEEVQAMLRAALQQAGQT
eukprot:CAMPEP_0196575378 /NCGR_PEP_ID=MMETSP1081-20130531/4873_1 /TAXON_ID=36882 /ORGANISM="Pyramimonas amylifera, Strain CCMP720" /LENGTH=86 /DNA_ID=CAMNT_0041893661 /DNA_START=85 /DNA_END=345 /DNA_ORIENTATION=-